jgi:hypothetical protein
LQKTDGTVVRGVDRFNGVKGYVCIVGDGKAGEPLGVSEFNGDDVLEEFADGLCTSYIAGL